MNDPWLCQACGKQFEPRAGVENASCPNCGTIQWRAKAQPKPKTKSKFDVTEIEEKPAKPAPEPLESPVPEGVAVSQNALDEIDFAQQNTLHGDEISVEGKGNLDDLEFTRQKEVASDPTPSPIDIKKMPTFGAPSSDQEKVGLDQETRPQVPPIPRQPLPPRPPLQPSMHSQIIEGRGSGNSIWSSLGPTLLVCCLFLGWVYYDKTLRPIRPQVNVVAQAMVEQAMESLERGDRVQAIVFLERAQELDPRSPLVFKLREIVAKGNR